MPLRLLSFDLDGTLIDTAGEIVIAANRALHERGLPELPAADIVAEVGHGSAALMRALHARLTAARPDGVARPDSAAVSRAAGVLAPDARQRDGDDADRAAVDALIAAFDRHYPDVIGLDSRPYPGAAQALEHLRAAGIVCVCTTNKNAAFSRALLHAHRLETLFDRVVGGDTLPWRKPDARVLQHVIASFRCAPHEAAHLGDSVTDIRAARGAGLHAWAAPWGYPGAEPIASAGPDLIFPSLLAAAEHALLGHAGTPVSPSRAELRRIHSQEPT